MDPIETYRKLVLLKHPQKNKRDDGDNLDLKTSMALSEFHSQPSVLRLCVFLDVSSRIVIKNIEL